MSTLRISDADFPFITAPATETPDLRLAPDAAPADTPGPSTASPTDPPRKPKPACQPEPRTVRNADGSTQREYPIDLNAPIHAGILNIFLFNFLDPTIPLMNLCVMHRLFPDQIETLLARPETQAALETIERVKLRRADAFARTAASEATGALASLVKHTSTNAKPETARKAANTLLKLAKEAHEAADASHNSECTSAPTSPPPTPAVHPTNTAAETLATASSTVTPLPTSSYPAPAATTTRSPDTTTPKINSRSKPTDSPRHKVATPHSSDQSPLTRNRTFKATPLLTHGCAPNPLPTH